MQIDRDDLDAAVQKGIITSDQATRLWANWEEEQKDVPTFRFSHLLYYFGGFLAISAITLFITTAWGLLQGWPLAIICILFFILGLSLTQKFLEKQQRIPAGIFATFALAVVPLAVYNIQMAFGWIAPQSFDYSDYHYYVRWYWFPMEITTLFVGAIMLYFYRFPFLLFPVSVTLWYMSMDMFPLVFGMTDYSYQDRANFSMVFGILMLFFALYMDLRYSDKRQDYAFWLYLFGVMTFWGGLTCQDSSNELGKFVYCLINLFMILLSVILNRRVFAVFGSIGVLMYLGHLAYSVFEFSLFFPVILVFLGFLIIFAASKWAQAEARMLVILDPLIPPALKRKRRG